MCRNILAREFKQLFAPLHAFELVAGLTFRRNDDPVDRTTDEAVEHGLQGGIGGYLEFKHLLDTADDHRVPGHGTAIDP